MQALTKGAGIKKQHIVFVGDPDQLPSVGWGNVLADMIQSKVVPVCKLQTIYRQGKENPIITNAQRMLRGDTEMDWSNRSFRRYHCGDDTDNMQAACKFYKRCVDQFGIDEVVMLSPYHRKTAISTDSLNRLLQDMMNPDVGQGSISFMGRVFRNGDRVMQLRNTDKLSNGDVGTVIGVYPRADGSETCLAVEYSDDLVVPYIREELVQLELAYAISVHKSQGSQYKTVIVVLPNESSRFLRRSILYTAITRSSMNVAIISPTDTIRACIVNDKEDERFTNLQARLRQASTK